MFSTAIIVSVGVFLLLLGAWILFMQVVGVWDYYRPNNLKIGTITVDNTESKSHAELFRARFDHHFQPKTSKPLSKGFVEVQTLDFPQLFLAADSESKFNDITIEVKGVNVGLLYRYITLVAEPPRWTIEGDIQTMPDRLLLSLRMTRGDRLIRTWYLEEYAQVPGEIEKEKALMLERLIDQAIFQIAFDLTNRSEKNEDIVNWQRSLPVHNISFPDRRSFAAFYDGKSALSRYFAFGGQKDLLTAIEKLRLLRAYMPDFNEGLKLLALALAENRNETEAIHVYEQLLDLMKRSQPAGAAVSAQSVLEIRSVELHKATALSKLYVWRSTHQAHDELVALSEKLDQDYRVYCKTSSTDAITTCAKFEELQALTSIQLAYCYGIYLGYLKDKMVATIFGNQSAPRKLRIEDQAKIKVLTSGEEADAGEVKEIVSGVIVVANQEHLRWLQEARKKARLYTGNSDNTAIGHFDARTREICSRYYFAAGYTHYRIAELEYAPGIQDADPIIDLEDFQPGDWLLDQCETETGNNHVQPEQWKDRPGKPGKSAFQMRLNLAEHMLRQAEAALPNNYQALQFLGQVYSEPRRADADLHIAEQYLERAIMVKPSAYYTYTLRAELMIRQIADYGYQDKGLKLIEKGSNDVETALFFNPTSNSANLLNCKYLILKLEVESDQQAREAIWTKLRSALTRAEHYSPRIYNHVSVDMDWINIVTETLKLQDEVKNGVQPDQLRELDQSINNIIARADSLSSQVELLQKRWVAHQHVFHATELSQRAQALVQALKQARKQQAWQGINLNVFKELDRPSILNASYMANR